MKKLITLLLTLTITIAYSQEHCKDFKVGKFQNIENGILKAEIYRSDSIQIEKYGLREVKMKVEWIDDCSYRLNFIEGNKAFWNSRPKNKPIPTLNVRITQTEGNSYIQESKFETMEDFTYTSKIIKIE